MTSKPGMMKVDVTQRVLDDHKEIKGCYDKIKALPDREAQPWFHQLMWTIARHSAAEEIVVYPMLEKTGPIGLELADKSRNDHQGVKEMLCALDGVEITPVSRVKIDQMMTDLLEHIQMEEDVGGDLDQLRKGISVEELMKAGSSYERTKMLVPTRAHPNAPDKPPFETVVGLLTAPLDKLKDVFRSFPDEQEVQRAAAAAH
jgi:hemerythrin superfamily protein